MYMYVISSPPPFSAPISTPRRSPLPYFYPSEHTEPGLRVKEPRLRGGGSRFGPGGPAEMRGLPVTMGGCQVRRAQGEALRTRNGGGSETSPPTVPCQSRLAERNAARFFAASAAPSPCIWGMPVFFQDFWSISGPPKQGRNSDLASAFVR